MNKLAKALPVLALFSCCSFKAGEIIIRPVGISITDINDEYIEFKGCIESSQTLKSYSYFVTFSYQAGDDPVKQITVEHLTSAKSGITVFSSVVRVDQASLKEENKLILEVDVTNLPLQSFSVKYNKGINNEKIYFSELDNNIGVKTKFYLESVNPADPSSTYVLEEKVMFLNFEDYVVNDFYYDLDFSKLRFKYLNTKDRGFTATARLAIYDRYGDFSNFPIGDNLYRYIDLDVINYDTYGFGFSFKNTIYYDPATHISSLESKEGYKTSQNLMLPLGRESDLSSINCYIELNITGYSRFTMIGYFDCMYLNRYYGDCSNSEFCQNNQLDDSPNAREKVIEVNT